NAHVSTIIKTPTGIRLPYCIHEFTEVIEAVYSLGIQVVVRDELLIAADSPEAEPPERFHESVRRDALDTPAMRPRRLDDTPVVAADGAQGEALSRPLEKLLQHRGVGCREDQAGP